jgi:nitroreductase
MSNYRDRYNGLCGDNTYPVSDAVERMIGRRTKRIYNGRPVPEELFKKLIAAAQSAPTSSMAQTWSVIVIKDPTMKAEFIKRWPDHLGIIPNDLLKDVNDPINPNKVSDWGNKIAVESCDMLLIWLVDMNRLSKIILSPDYGSTNDIKNVKDAARQALDTAHIELRSIIDVCLAANTFATAAELEGLGVMFCGSFRTMPLKDLLNLPDRVMPMFGMTVGYSDEVTGIKPRLPQDLIVHSETYQPLDEKRMREYNAGLKRTWMTYIKFDWFDRMITRTLMNDSNKYFRALAEKCGFKFM